MLTSLPILFRQVVISCAFHVVQEYRMGITKGKQGYSFYYPLRFLPVGLWQWQPRLIQVMSK